MGVWIEIGWIWVKDCQVWCHSLYGSVDWNLKVVTRHILVSCHSLYGSVDWNRCLSLRTSFRCCHSLYGSVDWNGYPWRHKVHHRVTPFMGVWIEIEWYWCYRNRGCSHSLYGSVDWNLHLGPKLCLQLRHSLYGSVDWNIFRDFSCKHVGGHSLYGSVDWNSSWLRLSSVWEGHSLYGSVDWNPYTHRVGFSVTLSLPLWECGLKSPTLLALKLYDLSLPLWECGLKSDKANMPQLPPRVTPFMGVWIEI